MNLQRFRGAMPSSSPMAQHHLSLPLVRFVVDDAGLHQGNSVFFDAHDCDRSKDAPLSINALQIYSVHAAARSVAGRPARTAQ